jgi:hypothetical protein
MRILIKSNDMRIITLLKDNGWKYNGETAETLDASLLLDNDKEYGFVKRFYKVKFTSWVEGAIIINNPRVEP